jgi:NodT family efflux transporter outer membrane factor (OMF) lipoprotein
MRALALLGSLLVLPGLVGCVLGPDFRAPSAPATLGTGFVRAGEIDRGPAPRIAPWWLELHDPALDELVQRALASNPSIEVAAARVRQARAAAAGARAAAAPVLGVNGAAGSVRRPDLLMGPDATSVFVGDADALWEIDLFGGRQRANEAAGAQLAGAQAGADDARLSLSAEVARRYVGLRAAQARLDLARRSRAAQQQIVELTQQLEGRGKVSRIERERAERALESAQLAVAALGVEVDDHKDALAVLVGEAPGALDARLEARGPTPLPPAEVAVGDPTAMLARRPDIRAAEQALRAANARIGVAEAARMPKITLAGVIGLAGSSRGDLASMDNLFSLASPTLQWNVGDFGRGRAAVEQAVAGRDEVDAAYRAAVLAALQDAEGALTRYGEARHALALQAGIARSARDSAGLADQAYRAGRTSTIEARVAEREQLAAEDALVQAQAALTIRYAALQTALAMGLA